MNPTLKDMIDLRAACPRLTPADVCSMTQDDIEVSLSRGTWRVRRGKGRPIVLNQAATLLVMRQPISEKAGALVFAKGDGSPFWPAELAQAEGGRPR